jgi:hypothetical protein
MARQSQDYPPNTRRMLNEIVVLLFAREAADSKGISPERIGALVAQFEGASTLDIAAVKSLLSRLVSELEKVESRIEIREMEESQRAYGMWAKADEERRRALVQVREEERRRDGAEKLRKWLAIDHERVLHKIKAKELLPLPEFLEARVASKRALSSAVAAGRIFFITGADGHEYYPAFFADSSEYIRQCLEKVCLALDGIPAYAKYQFLTTNCSWIGGGTPVDAILRARVNDVLDATKYLLRSS